MQFLERQYYDMVGTDVTSFTRVLNHRSEYDKLS